MAQTDPKVDAFIANAKRWQQETAALRKLILACKLTEELKWRQPCYTLNGTNIVLIGPFTNFCVLFFFKGALLKDAKRLLVRPSENTHSARQLRFTSLEQVKKLAPTVKAYVKEAIAAEQAGLKVRGKRKELLPPEEFQIKLDASPALNAAFNALTPGRQRAYNLFFTAAKQSKTRTARVEKCIPQILKGKGLLD